jgi:Ankyrin repeats (3 copies)
MKATPAHKAGYMGHADVARLLVADPRLELDAQGPFNGFTPLHDAIWHGHTETARVYIDAGARLDLRALDGRTPLEMARDYGYPRSSSYSSMLIASAKEAEVEVGGPSARDSVKSGGVHLARSRSSRGQTNENVRRRANG